jgi:hypothetical protein
MTQVALLIVVVDRDARVGEKCRQQLLLSIHASLQLLAAGYCARCWRD